MIFKLLNYKSILHTKTHFDFKNRSTNSKLDDIIFLVNCVMPGIHSFKTEVGWQATKCVNLVKSRRLSLGEDEKGLAEGRGKLHISLLSPFQ